MNKREKLLREIYEHIGNEVKYGSKKLTESLCGDGVNEANDLTHTIFADMLVEISIIEKQLENGEIKTLTSYIKNTTKNALLDMLKRENRVKNPEIVSYVEEPVNDEIPTLVFDTSISNGYTSNVENSEELYKKAELMKKLEGFFSLLEIEVMQGKVSRQEASKEVGVNYHSFTSKLARKINKFKKIHGRG